MVCLQEDRVYPPEEESTSRVYGLTVITETAAGGWKLYFYDYNEAYGAGVPLPGSQGIRLCV